MRFAVSSLAADTQVINWCHRRPNAPGMLGKAHTLPPDGLNVNWLGSDCYRLSERFDWVAKWIASIHMVTQS